VRIVDVIEYKVDTTVQRALFLATTTATGASALAGLSLLHFLLHLSNHLGLAPLGLGLGGGHGHRSGQRGHRVVVGGDVVLHEL